MKKIIFIILCCLLLSMSLLGCSCGSSSKYKDYDDFKRNGTYEEHKDFIDWCIRHP